MTGWQNNRCHSGTYALHAAARITREEITDARGQPRQEASADIGQQRTSYGSLGLDYVPAGQGGAGHVARVSYPSGKALQYRDDSSGQLTGLTSGMPMATGNRPATSTLAARATCQGLQRQFSSSTAHDKVLGVQDIEQHTGGSQNRKSQTLQWDESGKLQSDGQLHFARDAAGKVSGTRSGANNSNAHYITNALGQRIRKQTGAGNNRLITDTVYGEEAMAPGLQSFALGHYGRRQTGQGASASLSPAGVSEYICIPTAQGPMPIAAQINGKLYAIHTDQLNAPRQLTDENGHKLWQWAVSGFGEVEPTTAGTGWIRKRNGTAGARSGTLPVSFSLRFPGQQFDQESGLHCNHHRYYDPCLTLGYTEADPLGLSAGAISLGMSMVMHWTL